MRQRGGRAGRSRREPGRDLLPGSPKEATLPIDGHTLKFTNLAKLYYPGDGVTKRDVLNYYAAVADLILPHLQDRPLSLKRYPNGIREQFFFQKDTPDTYPGWLRTELIDEINYVFASDRASLLYLVNLGCIDHNPWMSRSGSLEHPDFILIDLDPQECSYDLIVEAALLVKRILDQIGLVGYPKTTGGDGMHVYIPIEPVYSYEEARTFAELIARLVTHEKPHLFTTPRMVAKRQKEPRVFRLPADRQIEDHRGALCAAGVRRSPGGDAAGVGRGDPRPAPETVPHSQRPRAIPPEGRSVPRRAGAPAEPVRGSGPPGNPLPVEHASWPVIFLLPTSP